MQQGHGYARAVDAALGEVSPDRVLLVTDFDGTLAGIVDDPAAARARPDSIETLADLVSLLQHVTVLSGRTTEALRSLVPLAGVELLGDYGLLEPDPAERDALAAFNRLCAARIDEIPGARLEVKAGSSSVHHRPRADLAQPAWELVAPLAERAGLRATRGRMVVEVRPPRADKGRALVRILARERPLGLVVLGDDEGDRPMFEVATAQPIPHLAVGVGSPEAPGGLFDSCDLVVPGPAGVSALLAALSRWARGTGRAGPGAASRSTA